MMEADFLREISAILQADPGSIALSDQLVTLSEWDSMAVVMFIAMADEHYGISVDAGPLSECQTIGDLARLCNIEHGVRPQ